MKDLSQTHPDLVRVAGVLLDVSYHGSDGLCMWPESLAYADPLHLQAVIPGSKLVIVYSTCVQSSVHTWPGSQAWGSWRTAGWMWSSRPLSGVCHNYYGGKPVTEIHQVSYMPTRQSIFGSFWWRVGFENVWKRASERAWDELETFERVWLDLELER